jgi:hypothetical protein
MTENSAANSISKLPTVSNLMKNHTATRLRKIEPDGKPAIGHQPREVRFSIGINQLQILRHRSAMFDHKACQTWSRNSSWRW